MNGQHKKNLTVSERTLSQLYLMQGHFQQRYERKVTLSETVDFLLRHYDTDTENFKLEEKPQ